MSYLSERAISSMIYLFLKSSDTYNVYIENELDLFFEAVYRIRIEESKNLEAKKELDLFKKVFKNELIEGDYSVNDENKNDFIKYLSRFASSLVVELVSNIYDEVIDYFNDLDCKRHEDKLMGMDVDGIIYTEDDINDHLHF